MEPEIYKIDPIMDVAIAHNIPEPPETSDRPYPQSEVKPPEIPKTLDGIQAGDRVKVISSVPTYQQCVRQILEVAEVKTPQVALLHLGDGRTGVFTISEFIKVDDAVAPDDSDPAIIETSSDTITTDGDGRVVIQPEFTVGAAVVADFSQHNQKTPPQGLQGIRDGQAGKIARKVHYDQYLEYWVLFKGRTKETAVPPMFLALAKKAIAPHDSTNGTVLEQVETMNDERSPSIDTPAVHVQAIDPVVMTSATNLGVVVHVKHSEYDQYIGRANSRYKLAKSKWHNPYQVGRDGDRPTVLHRFESHLVGNQSLMGALEELRGKRIACWCCDAGEILTADDPLKCHGQILLRRLRGDYTEQPKTVLEHLETMKEFRFEPMQNSQKVLQGCLF